MATCIKCAASGKAVKAEGRFLVQSPETRRIVFHGYLCKAHRQEFEASGCRVIPIRYQK